MKPNLNLRTLHFVLRILIGMVWFVNGLICKVLGLVPRHEQIVAQILGDRYAGLVTPAIGLGEIFLAIWIWSGIQSRVAALLQIALVVTMNVLEFIIASDLLLWGPLNSVFATLFAIGVGWHEFWLKPRASK